jgi:glutamyl-tRNA synthetase
MAPDSPRLRFAPSPTGSLHLGNARTALINWVMARAAKGTLVLRIEDTDVARNVAGAEEHIFETLRWLGVDWDEGPGVGGDHGPYRQSERRAMYDDAVAQLLETEHAYYCFEEPGELRITQLEARQRGQPFRHACRDLPRHEAFSRVEAGEPAAIRFRVPDRAVRFVDGLRGATGVQAGEIDDFVVARRDGTPTYQLAVVVDDHGMSIDQVVRGQDHLSNTPKQLLLYEALGWTSPGFTHLPLVLGADRSRMSKRHGDVTVEQMRDSGVLPEALANYLTLLGWAPPDGHEVWRLAELAERFQVENLSSTNVGFDPSKLDWLNQQHLQALPLDDFLERANGALADAGFEMAATGPAREWWRELVDLLRPSLRRIDELPHRLQKLMRGPGPEAQTESDPRHHAALSAFHQASRAGELTAASDFKAVARRIGEATGLSGRELFQPLRNALTGENHGPELARLVPLIENARSRGVEPDIETVAERIEALVAKRG